MGRSLERHMELTKKPGRKRTQAVILLIAIVFTSFGALVTPKASVSAESPISNVEVIDGTEEWRYLDDNTDPNIGTWYESWNKRNGWAYPLDFLDWGVVPMDFSDETWSDGYGPFSFDAEANGGTELKKTAQGKACPTYFFRYTFELENPSEIVAISGTVRYKDAAIVYINGKPIDYLLNIPVSNYPENLVYGCSEKFEEKYDEVDFIVQDTSSLREGYNTVAVEVHTSDPNTDEVYFELLSLVLNPDDDTLPEVPSIKALAVNAGSDESELNLAWYALSSIPGQVQIAKKSDMKGSAFPATVAKTFNSVNTGSAYTQFYDKYYYYNKVTVTGLERGEDYVYRVGNAYAWSDIYDFSTQDISDGYDVLFVTDAQIGTGTIPTDTYGWNKTLESAFGLSPNVSLIANTGDMVDVANKESEYDAYFNPEILKSYPTATAVGNHDIAANYSYHYNEPNLSGIGGNAANSDYYFTYGNILYLVINANNTNNAEHARFMKETVEAMADRDFDWTILMMHQSMYCSATQSTGSAVTNRRDALVPVIDELGIDIVLAGHDHSYTRTHHMENFEILPEKEYDDNGYEIEPDGTLYLTMSSASGSKYYDIVAEYDYSANQQQLYVPTFALLSFTDNTFSMTTYRSDTLEVIDEYAMIKDADEPVQPKVTLDVTSISLKEGESRTLKATITPTEADVTMTWKSSDDKVAEVDQAGKVTAKGEGTAVITVTLSNGESASCTVKVTAKAVTPDPEEHPPYIEGYPDGTIRPDANITRAEAAAMIYRIIEDEDKDVPVKSPFTDVDTNDWYVQEVAYLAKKGIITGYPGNIFEPGKYITRAEIAAIISRLYDLKDSKSTFIDVPDKHWAYEYIGNLADAGWVEGYPDGTFLPDKSCTRAETIKIINAALGRKLEDIPEDAPEFKDLKTTHWAYAEIIAAAITLKY